MSQWQTMKLGEVIKLQRGYDLTEKDRNKGSIPIYGSAGVHGYHDTAKVKAPGAVIGRSGASFGVAHYCSIDFWPHNTVLFITDFCGNNPKYVYYLLTNLNFTMLNSGSAQASLNRNYVYTLPVYIPKYSVQVKISSILSAYDDLIENNLRRIKILEEMTQNIYREWFVNFCFPGHEKARFVDSKLGKIPEGWEVKNVGEIATLIKDRFEYNRHNKYPLLDLAKMQRQTLLVNETGDPSELTTSRTIFEEDDILFGSIRPYLHKVALAPFQGVTNVSVLVIRPNENSLHSYLTIALSSLETIHWADQHSTGTKMPVIKWESLKLMPVVVPTQDLLLNYQRLANPILDTVKNTYFLNKNLRQTRDLLLPKLISGEVDVSDLDITLPEEALA